MPTSELWEFKKNILHCFIQVKGMFTTLILVILFLLNSKQALQELMKQLRRLPWKARYCLTFLKSVT